MLRPRGHGSAGGAGSGGGAAEDAKQQHGGSVASGGASEKSVSRLLRRCEVQVLFGTFLEHRLLWSYLIAKERRAASMEHP